MENFNTVLLDDMLEKQAEIHESNKRLSIKINEALEASSISPPLLDLTGPSSKKGATEVRGLGLGLGLMCISELYM